VSKGTSLRLATTAAIDDGRSNGSRPRVGVAEQDVDDGVVAGAELDP
jgi:hypothetical protein